MRFTTEYSKLKLQCFTTIRKNTSKYKMGTFIKVQTPEQEFDAWVIGRQLINKVHISPAIAKFDADCTWQELVEKLEKWYGKEFDDYVLLTLLKEKGAGK